jgi:hypothetical protein
LLKQQLQYHPNNKQQVQQSLTQLNQWFDVVSLVVTFTAYCYQILQTTTRVPTAATTSQTTATTPAKQQATRPTEKVTSNGSETTQATVWCLLVVPLKQCYNDIKYYRQLVLLLRMLQQQYGLQIKYHPEDQAFSQFQQ